MKISKECLQFLSDLKENNNKAWFEEHKPIYKQHQAATNAYFEEVQERLKESDLIEGFKVYRIYRDVRFSKDKTPYKHYIHCLFKRATAALRGGYWLGIEPGDKSIVGGGFYGPNPADLKRIRKDIEFDEAPLRAIIEDKQFKKFFGTIKGAEVKTAPRGFSTEHPAIDLIRKKQFYVMRSFTDKQVTSAKFMDQVVETHLALRPFFDYMSEVLTMNADGESEV